LGGLTTAITVAQGGTNATTAAGARTNLGAAASGANTDILSLGGLTTALSVPQGGTGGTTAAAARTSLGAAASGANTDILSLAGLTTMLALNQGGSAKNMTAVNGGVVYTDADSMEVSAAGTAGQVLTSAGAGTPTWQTPSNPNSHNKIVMWEDFLAVLPVAAGANAVAQQGTSYVLTQAGGGFTAQASTANRVGINRLTVPATASQNHMVAFCTAAAGTLQPNTRLETTAQTFVFEAAVLNSSVAANTGMLRLGLWDQFSVTAGTPKGVYFEILGAASPVVSCVVKNAGSSSCGGAATADTSFHYYKIVYDGTNVTFSIDGTTYGSAVANTNLPTLTALCAGVSQTNVAAAMVAKTVDFDYVGYAQDMSTSR
jgi:hypothetical protein